MSLSQNLKFNFDKLENFSLPEQVNKISFNLKTLNEKNNSFVKIYINQMNENLIENSENKITNKLGNEGANKSKSFMILLFFCLALIGIAYLILYLLKKNQKMNNNKQLEVELGEIEDGYKQKMLK